MNYQLLHSSRTMCLAFVRPLVRSLALHGPLNTSSCYLNISWGKESGNVAQVVEGTIEFSTRLSVPPPPSLGVFLVAPELASHGFLDNKESPEVMRVGVLDEACTFP